VYTFSNLFAFSWAVCFRCFKNPPRLFSPREFLTVYSFIAPDMLERFGASFLALPLSAVHHSSSSSLSTTAVRARGGSVRGLAGVVGRFPGRVSPVSVLICQGKLDATTSCYIRATIEYSVFFRRQFCFWLTMRPDQCVMPNRGAPITRLQAFQILECNFSHWPMCARIAWVCWTIRNFLAVL
jgi:hypothetical protein